MTVKFKIKVPKACEDGKHTFIPATWKTTGSTKKCTLFVCQHCMCTVDLNEQEVMMVEHNKKAHEKFEKHLETMA